MLRSTRGGLLLLAIVAIIAAVGTTYFHRRISLAKHAPQAPKSLPLNTDATATDWVWKKDEGNQRTVEIRAKNFKQFNNPSRLDLDQVELRLYKEEGKSFDRIRSAKAQFDENRDTLYSDGEVEIKLDVPAEGPPHGHLLTIHSSGVTFENKTGKAWTERSARFTFDQGDGRAVGASYDPNAGELVMKSQVELHWRGRGPESKPMKIETGELAYREHESKVFLKQWARLTREDGVLEAAGDTLVLLKDGAIQRVEAKQAHGSDRQPGRQLEYAAGRLYMDFTPEGEAEKITGDGSARLVSTSDAGRTTMTGDRVEMAFDVSSGESVLQTALATGSTTTESDPVARPGVLTPEGRRLRSEAVLVTMRTGGKEIEKFETQAPGHLEFIPTRAGQRHRTLDADRMTMLYGHANQPQSFRASNAATRTDPDPSAGKDAAPSQTWSTDLAADFDPKTGQLAHMRQWGDFRYQEGERKARANQAMLEQASNLITLEGAARVWDPTGAASADRILLDQKTGEMTALGHVVSTRAPDSQGKSSAMLANDKPLEATADHMQTAESNQKIHYDGHAVAWQGANRIWADNLDIDRAARTLVALGGVKTQFMEQQKQETSSSAGANAVPAFVVIHAAKLVYTEANRLAHYTGGTHLTRPSMDVKASEIRAYLNDANADSSLDHAFADGRVDIVRTEPERTVKGSGEHGEYYTSDQRIVLTGGEPTLIDSARGYTKGRKLTYYADNDKLLVDGAEKQPVRSLLHHR